MARSRTIRAAVADGDPLRVVQLGVGGIRPEWPDGVRVVGLTRRGVRSTGLVDGVVRSLEAMGPIEVRERETDREPVRFLPPTHE